MKNSARHRQKCTKVFM